MTPHRSDSPERSKDRGKPAGTTPAGEVTGSGAGIANPDSDEDYDDDLAIGSGSANTDGRPSNSA